ncbi:tetratricopeptide repeat protein [Halobacteriovorax sp. GB3]|uniref:tetratricopeptide repeat protein n=1 Tax=Halobacteriovorax sp. GB3 TaxID=2719615 RepID=UPI00235F661B|nr:tetratricopeptide repeat protein [Halobacteriovorax sp. GB3]MDD0852426.1 tetratricopeptide repeat protein [Halobacteriovorax sp. GB3]
MKYLILISLVLLASCGTSTKKEVVNKDVPFYWIDNADFKPVEEISYDEGDDYYSGDIEEQDSVSVETMAKIPPSRLMDLVDENDPISKPISLCYQNNFVAAFNKFDRTYKKLKNNASYWNQVGTCYLLKGETRKSLLYYNKARDLVKDYSPAINNIGIIHFKNGNKEKAMAAFKEAYDLNQFSLTPAYNLAMLYLQYGFITKAEPLLVALYKRNNKDVDIVNGLAHLYMMKGNYAKAVQAFSLLPSDVMNKPQVSISMGYALYKFGRKDQALNVLKGVEASLTPDFSKYYVKITKIIREGK